MSLRPSAGASLCTSAEDLALYGDLICLHEDVLPQAKEFVIFGLENGHFCTCYIFIAVFTANY